MVPIQRKAHNASTGWKVGGNRTGLYTGHISNFLIWRKDFILGGMVGAPGFRELGALGEELLAVPYRANRLHVLVQKIDLLKRQTLCLGDAEVRKNDAAETCRAPDVKHLGAQVCIPGAGVDHVGCCQII